jgi:hypothetical protein
MVKKGMKKKNLGWIPSSFDDADQKKAKREGFLLESVEIVFPSTEAVLALPMGFWGDVRRFPPPQFLPSCPRISSWASICVRRAAASAHANFFVAHCLLHHSM